VLEVELKAWADLDDAQRRLEALGKPFEKSSVKEDVYFCGPDADPKTCDPRRDRVVRIRVEASGETLVTAKRKKVEGSVETSQEIEFRASSADAVRALLDYLGYRPFLRKRKENRTYLWSEGIHVELNRIAGLGDFVEIEALVPEGSPPERVAAAREEIRSVARALGVEDRLEGRLYVDLLRERGVA
jgi:predicted adenylyl cyclase CyaB